MGRRSIWSKEAIIELSEQFVPATDEVWRLQNGSDPECRHFQKLAEVGHYRNHKSTRQGIYVSTPSGILLGSLNTHNTAAVLEIMRQGLKKYGSMDPERRKLSKDSEFQPTHRWEGSYPDGGLDLTMYARDLPESCDPVDKCQPSWNQDRVWFTPSEARKFLPENRAEIVAGAQHEIPELIVSRLARFSVIDTVRGQTSFYAAKDVADSKLSIRVEDVNGSVVELSIRGSTKGESNTSRGRNLPHGIETNLLGQAKYDLDKNSFSQFELVAVGTRWGRTVFNGRSHQLEKSPVGFVFRLTPDNAPLIAPSFLFAYGVDWVQHPKRTDTSN